MKKFKLSPLSLTIFVAFILILFLSVFYYYLGKFNNHLALYIINNSKYLIKNQPDDNKLVLGQGTITDNVFVLNFGFIPDDSKYYAKDGVVEVEKGIIIRHGNDVVMFAHNTPVEKIFHFFSNLYILSFAFAFVLAWVVFVLYIHFMRSVKVLESSIQKRVVPTDSSPNLKGFSGIFRGISDLYMELHETENAVNRKSKLENLGILLSKILHDLNNVISTLKIYHYIMNNTDDDVKKQECLNKINDSLENMTEMVSETFSFVRGDSQKLYTKVRIKDLSSGLITEYEEKAKLDSVKFEVIVEEGIQNQLISVNVLQVMAALRNLIQNAFEELNDCYKNGGEKILIISFKRILNDLQIEIKDNGRGLPVLVVERLFTPFITEGKDGGTGLGISTAKEYIENNGGIIDVETGKKGTAFKILIPLIDTGSTDQL
ncbi:MAG: HAMP domain-containing histidine kinase [Chlorobi bacterium]|nr:HAMP domain-containing histidine kinase [Chlorobiota bacterium]